MPRLFAAIEIPPMVAQFLTGLRGGIQGARWIDPENYHITLRFIGDVDDREADEIIEILGRVKRPVFDLSISGIGVFGGKRPHSIWAGIDANPDLMGLQGELERLLQQVGQKPESRKYSPHVTIARLRGVPSSAVARYMAGRGLFRPPPFTVERFVLYSSRASMGGGPYLVEETYDLEG